jgi:hypothetical protein
MPIPPDIAEWLTRRIEEFVRDNNEPEYLRPLVSRYSVLPLYIGWTGFYGLRTDGEILLVDTDNGNEPVVETDALKQRIALFQGAKKYREIEPLFPRRPVASRDCPHCLETGKYEFFSGAIYYCGGCGWIEFES